jgi:hypothetical protein
VYDFITRNGLTGFGPELGFPGTGGRPALTGDAAVFLSNGTVANNGIILQRYYGSRNNVSEQPGMRRFDLADRNRDKVRTSANWQATERLTLDAGVDFSYDQYDQTVYGLQGARDLALNLDGTYLLGENFSFSVFGSYENQRATMKSRPTNIANAATAANPGNDVLSGSPCFTSRLAQVNVAKIDPCNVWSANMTDQTGTLGLALTKKAMLNGKLDMTGSLLFTRAVSEISVSGGTYVANPDQATVGQPGSFYIPAEDLPRVTTDVIELSLRGDYNINKSSAIRAIYSYQRLKSSADWAYAGLQTGTLTGEMPTNEQVPTYSVNVVGVSYVYRFQ